MSRLLWFAVLAAASAAVLTASPSIAAAPGAGPCLPPGVPVPHGVHIPHCPKPVAASNLRVKVDGSVTVVYALHSIYWGQRTPATGGGSHTDASADLGFGTPAPAAAAARYRTDTKTKKKVLVSLDAVPEVEATPSPKQDQRHEVAPGCGVVKDPTNCTQSKGQGGVTVHLSDLSDLARVTVRPPAVIPTQCIAPFTGDSVFDNLSFQHALDEEEEALMAHVANPASKIRSGTIQWDNPQKPCSAYGVTKPILAAGTVEKCTIKADFRIVISRLSQPKR